MGGGGQEIKRDAEGERKGLSLDDLLAKISRQEKVERKEIRSGNRRRGAVKARKLFCQIAVKELGYSGAAVARFLGVTTSLVNLYAAMAVRIEAGRRE